MTFLSSHPCIIKTSYVTLIIYVILEQCVNTEVWKRFRVLLSFVFATTTAFHTSFPSERLLLNGGEETSMEVTTRGSFKRMRHVLTQNCPPSFSSISMISHCDIKPASLFPYRKEQHLHHLTTLVWSF